MLTPRWCSALTPNGRNDICFPPDYAVLLYWTIFPFKFVCTTLLLIFPETTNYVHVPNGGQTMENITCFYDWLYLIRFPYTNAIPLIYRGAVPPVARHYGRALCVSKASKGCAGSLHANGWPFVVSFRFHRATMQSICKTDEKFCLRDRYTCIVFPWVFPTAGVRHSTQDIFSLATYGAQ